MKFGTDLMHKNGGMALEIIGEDNGDGNTFGKI